MKKALALLLALIMMLSLAACGGENEAPTIGNAIDPETVRSIEEKIAAGKKTDPETVQPTEEKSPDGKKFNKETAQPAEEKSPAGDKTEKPTEPELTGPVPLQILMGSHYNSEFDQDDEFTKLCSVEWSSLLLDTQSAADFPALAQALRDMTEFDFEYNAEILKEMVPYAEEAAAQQEYFGGYFSNTRYYVQRADDRILSVRVDMDQYSGGPHPDYWVIGWNLDPATGESMALSDVLTDVECLPDILAEIITEKYALDSFSELHEQLEEYDEGYYNWTLDYQGITFYFSPYDIAPYAAGLLTATIWFDERPELFTAEYTLPPVGGWAKLLPEASEIEADLNPKDGEKDSLWLSQFIDEHGLVDLHITINGDREQHLEECYGFYMKPLLVCLGKPGSERYYLYVEAMAENDYRIFHVYDLSGEEIAHNSELEGARFSGVWEESLSEYGSWFERILNDPSEFVLDSTIQCLGTWTGYRTYRTDPKTGALKPQTDHYMLSEPVAPIVSAIELEVTMLPDGKTETLPAGTVFYFKRYYFQEDTLQYAELELEDGRECRIEIVLQDWTPMIQGTPEWDCFEELMYAG